MMGADDNDDDNDELLCVCVCVCVCVCLRQFTGKASSAWISWTVR